MKKQPEITEKTRRAFVGAFCDLYSQKPIDKISIQEIANKSGYNRSTFYQYFSDIYELLVYVENDLLDYMREHLKSGQNSNQTVQRVIQFFEEKGLYLNALLGDYGSIRFLERIKQEIPLDELDMELSADNPLAPYLIEYHVSTSISLFRLWLRRGKDISHKVLFDFIDRLYLGGVNSIIK